MRTGLLTPHWRPEAMHVLWCCSAVLLVSHGLLTGNSKGRLCDVLWD